MDRLRARKKFIVCAALLFAAASVSSCRPEGGPHGPDDFAGPPGATILIEPIVNESITYGVLAQAAPTESAEAPRLPPEQRSPSATPAVSPTPLPSPTPAPSYLKLAFTGDLMMHDVQLDKAYDPLTDTHTFAHYDYVSAYLNGADYAVGNLETTLSGKEAGYATYPLFNAPDSFGEAIKKAGYDFVTTANNHCYDKRESGLLRTVEILDSLGLGHAGTYATEEESEKIFVGEINGITFAILSYTYSTNGIPVAAGKPWQVNMLGDELMKRQIEEARGLADVVIVSPHMGNEYEEVPAARYVNLCRNLCEWGADAVMAHHPHVLQPVEVYVAGGGGENERICFIAYSMGNFVSGQRTAPRDAGAIFYLDYMKQEGKVTLVGASFVPTWVRLVNGAGRHDIKVVPIYEALRGNAAGERYSLRQVDLNRMREVHRETTKKLLGEEVAPDAMLPVYVLYDALG